MTSQPAKVPIFDLRVTFSNHRYYTAYFAVFFRQII